MSSCFQHASCKAQQLPAIYVPGNWLGCAGHLWETSLRAGNYRPMMAVPYSAALQSRQALLNGTVPAVSFGDYDVPCTIEKLLLCLRHHL